MMPMVERRIQNSKMGKMKMSNRTLVLQGPNILKLLDTNCLSFVDITGPDGLRDHRKRVYHDFDQHVTGIGATSSESSSAVSYLFRGSPNAPFPKGKHGQVGEIGWEAENLWQRKY